ncbi:NADH-cytochrome b5 reductase [Dinochytrium kinnereticum]|nr:NADH-cytochrome b5 reductase [Dinochytrium kinnereticum]
MTSVIHMDERLGKRDACHVEVLQKDKWVEIKMIEKKMLSPDTALYTFAFPSKDGILGLPIGKHIQLKAKIDGKDVSRSYTPVSKPDEKGVCRLVVKAYPSGLMSRHLDRLGLGETILMRGPTGSFSYVPNMCSEIVMLAGGSGITPMYQIIDAILSNPKDATTIKLIYANKTEQDILLREDLDVLASENSKQLSLHYVLEKTPSSWSGSKGFITKDVIQKFSPSPDAKFLICGPPPMVNGMAQICEQLGYPKARALSKAIDQVFKF